MEDLTTDECLYAILEVSKDATIAEIRKSYQALVLKHHPDKSQVYSNSGSTEYMKIDQAWKVLRDAELRKQYDAQTGQQEYNETPIVNETLQKEELDINGAIFERPCRCGGSYTIDKYELAEMDSSFYLNCSECSLVIEILINVN